MKGTGHCGLPLSLICGFLLPFLLPFNLFIRVDVPKSVLQKKRVVDHTRALKPSDCVNNPQSRTIATIESVAGKEVNALAQSAFQRDNMFLVFIHQLLAQLLPQAENLVIAGVVVYMSHVQQSLLYLTNYVKMCIRCSIFLSHSLLESAHSFSSVSTSVFIGTFFL